MTHTRILSGSNQKRVTSSTCRIQNLCLTSWHWICSPSQSLLVGWHNGSFAQPAFQPPDILQRSATIVLPWSSWHEKNNYLCCSVSFMASKYVSRDIYYKHLASKQDKKAMQYVITKHVICEACDAENNRWGDPNRTYLSCTDFIGSGNIILQVYFLT